MSTLAELDRQEEMVQESCKAILNVMVATKNRIDAVLKAIGYSSAEVETHTHDQSHDEMAKSIVADAFCEDCIESIIREFVRQGSGDSESDNMRKVVDELKNCGRWE